MSCSADSTRHFSSESVERSIWHTEVETYGNAPVIPPRIKFHVRQIGGLHELHNCSLERMPHMRRGFADAYRLALGVLELERKTAKHLNGLRLQRENVKHSLSTTCASRLCG